MAIEKLTAATVARLRAEGLHSDGGGLYLLIGPEARRSWIFRYTSPTTGRRREAGFGPVHTISLQDARAKARDWRRLVADGADPLGRVVRKRRGSADGAAMTFRQAGAAYIDAHRAGWKNAKHGDQWAATLDAYVWPIIGDLAVSVIETADILDVLQPIWTRIPETAGRVRGRMEAVLAWATVSGHRTGDNPARWRGHLDQALPARAKVARVEHHAALPYREMPDFWPSLTAAAGNGAAALRFAILTAARSGEVRGMTWREIDTARGLWTVPAERMKAGREHVVPLSTPALAILADMQAGALDAVVFPGTRGQALSDMSLTAALRRMGRGDLTAHGFRSTFRDWAGETTDHAREVIEHALAHQLKDKAEAAYQRGTLLEKRRGLMDDWGRYVVSKGVF